MKTCRGLSVSSLNQSGAVEIGANPFRRHFRKGRRSPFGALRTVGIIAITVVLVYFNGFPEAEAASVCEATIASYLANPQQQCETEQGTVEEVTRSYQNRGYVRFQDTELWRNTVLPEYGDLLAGIPCEVLSEHDLDDDTDYFDVMFAIVCASVTEDFAGVMISRTELRIVEGENASYAVSLGSEPEGTVTVSIGVIPLVLPTVFPSPPTFDVTVSTTSLSFSSSNWSVPQTVTVRVAEDDHVSGDLEYTIAHRVGGYGNVTTADDVVVLAVDNDSPSVTVTPTALAVDEGSTGSYTVVLTSNPDRGRDGLTVTVTPKPDPDNADVTFTPTSLSFTADNWSTEQRVTVSAADDPDALDESATITHEVSGYGNVTSADAVTVTVRDDDSDGVTVTPTALTVDEGESRSYSVSLQSVPDGEVTVTPNSSNPDVILSPADLTFTANNWQVAQIVTVRADVDDDSTDDVATISHAVTGYGDLTDGGEVSVTVTEPVPAEGVQLSPSALRVLEGGSATYAVSLESEPTGPVTVTPSSSNPDVTLSSASLTFTANDWQVAQIVTVRADVDDDSTDDVATISHAVTGYGDLTDGGEVTVTVTEPVPAEAVQLSLSALRVREGGSRTYTVNLGSEPTGPVTVEPQSDSQSVTVSPASLTFTSGNWNTPQPVTVRAVADDDTVEETVIITHSVTGFEAVTEGGSIAVTVEETAPQVERESVSTTLATVTSSTVSNVATNIGTRFSAARAGTSLSLAGRTITLGDAYERTFVDQYGESFQNGEYDARDLDLDDVLRSAAFQIALGAADGTGAHPAAQWTLWGRGDLQFFSSDPSRGAGYDGQLQAGYFGVDVQLDGRWLAGVAVSRTSADADYSVEADSAGNDGRIDVTLTSVLPYVRFALDERTDLWAILGAGGGEIENRRPNSRSPAENSDVTLLMASAGARRALATDGPLGWALLGDFNAGRVETDDGAQAIAGLTVDVWRTRLGVEGSYTQQLEDGVTLTSFMEMTGRHDGGDGEDQFGLELSPGLYLSDPASRIGVELRGRVLALNSADDYEEYGVSATVSVLPRTDGLGVSLSLAPAWGSAGTASASEFRRDDDFLASVSAPHERAGMSLNSRLGYGVAVASGRLTPFGEFSLRDGDRRKSRMGIRFDRRNSGLGDLSLELVGERGESLDGESDQRLSAAGRLRF